MIASVESGKLMRLMLEEAKCGWLERSMVDLDLGRDPSNVTTPLPPRSRDRVDMAIAIAMPQSAHEHVATPYFPRSGSKHGSSLLLQQLPPPPKAVGPIFDPEHVKEPLPVFDQKAHEQYYNGPSETGEALPPPSPDDFEDRYLVPTLSRNERLRLTMLWYHTSQIEKEERLLAEIDTLVRSAQKVIGWEYAIAGILNESTFRRLAAVNLPLAVLPRRESTCSHTINQDLDNVFMVLDMSKDWRFRHSPHSKIGGLKSYAGAPLRLMTDNGVEIPLGSLCVASDTPQKPLGKRRLKKRQEMTELLSVLRSKIDAEDYEESAIRVIQQAYQEAHVSLQAAVDGRVPVKGRTAVKLSDVEEGLWEDTALIDQTIMSSNFDELKPIQTVRAIIARCGSSEKYVVVSGLDIHHVFDDFDAWFIFRAAAVISDTLQSRLLRQAISAKETFLRGITHQLRTPIHGVLSSTELLAEELNVRGLLLPSDANAASVSPAACIGAIQNSGQELMRTVNSILKYNTWTDTTRQKCHIPYDLNRLEADILPETLSHILQDHLRGISIEFRNKMSHSRPIVTDPDLLNDLLEEILLNAIQAVSGRPSGTVTLTMRNNENETNLIFDIVDNGIGIEGKDQSSIFQPFYKVDDFKLGAGLGLTIAKQIAASLRGTVELISSSPGAGSHFRVEFRNPILGAPLEYETKPDITLQHLPQTYHRKVTRKDNTHFADHITRYLEFNSFQKQDTSDVGLIFTDSDTKELRDAYPSAVIITFGEVKTGVETRPGSGIFTASGPLHGETLKAMLLRADTMYRELADENFRRESVKAESIVNGINGVGTLPITQIAALSILDNQPSPPDRSDQPIKALLVDDNPVNLRILQMYCSKRKIPYATAEDGNIAIEQFVKGVESKDPFTLVLMDLQMPNCDGIEATRAIRTYEHENALCKSFIFMVTGQDWGKDKVAAQDAGTDMFLIKPVSPKILDKHITSSFTKYQPVGG
ncbi:hypothetical protein FHL15_009160 [Xylaria flabelliformis]|uniref:histidine kinase n=1 Tax=Xylaria flabelliformis TaxID=2512241 RepID=A0A553HPK5_9PEZI|nr:hypothetical protein FHL15_009160 [Xylaria flabelliformis]